MNVLPIFFIAFLLATTFVQSSENVISNVITSNETAKDTTIESSTVTPSEVAEATESVPQQKTEILADAKELGTSPSTAEVPSAIIDTTQGTGEVTLPTEEKKTIEQQEETTATGDGETVDTDKKELDSTADIQQETADNDVTATEAVKALDEDAKELGATTNTQVTGGEEESIAEEKEGSEAAQEPSSEETIVGGAAVVSEVPSQDKTPLTSIDANDYLAVKEPMPAQPTTEVVTSEDELGTSESTTQQSDGIDHEQTK